MNQRKRILVLTCLTSVACVEADPMPDASAAPAPPLASGGLGTGGATATGGAPGGRSGGGGLHQGTGSFVGAGGAAAPAGGAPSAGAPSSGGLVTTVSACSGAPEVDPGVFPRCNACDGARCVPNAAVPEAQRALLDSCDGATTCVPDSFVKYAGQFVPRSCRSLEDAEGRCIPVCVPDVAVQKDSLPVEDCAPGERCAPCYNPIDGTDTGACTNGCDTGPTEPAKTFTTCGSNGPDGSPLGLCVPTSAVPAAQREALPSCAPDHLCAPKIKVVDQANKFPTCVSTGALFSPGACAPQYLVDLDPLGFMLAQDTCEVGFKCAPCTNPLTQANTHACE